MKTLPIIITISILLVAGTGDIESNNEKTVFNYHNIVEKISEAYNKVREQMTIAYKNFIERNFKPPNYEFQILDAVNLKDCVENSLDSKQPCFLVNLDMKNSQNDSITFEITTRTIVTGNGKQLDKYGGLYNTRLLNELCDTPNFFKLFPNANKKVGICFPMVTKEDDPVLYVSVTANGKQKEHSFDLSPYIS